MTEGHPEITLLISSKISEYIFRFSQNTEL